MEEQDQPKIEEGVKTWAKIIERYGHQTLNSIKQTKDGGYIATGPFGRNGTETPTGHQAHDAYLLKLDSDGNEVWEKNIGPTAGIGSMAQDIRQTNDGGYIIVGMTKFESDPSAEWVYIVKTGEQGTKVWDKAYSLFKNDPEHDVPSSVQETSDGGYIVGGTTSTFSASDNVFSPNVEAFLLKTDKYGNRLWEKHYGGDGAELVGSVEQTYDGGYIIGGTTFSHINSTMSDDTHAYLVKTDADGNKLWERAIDAFDEHEHDEIESIQQTSDGGYIMAGVTVCDSALNSRCAYLLKVDENGNKVWENSYKECETSTLFQVHQTSDNGYVAIGHVGGTECIDEHPDGVYLLKTDENGNRIWQKKFGWYKLASEAYRTNNDPGDVGLMGRSVEQTSDGGYIIAGYVYYAETSPWQDDIILIKTDGNGNI